MLSDLQDNLNYVLNGIPLPQDSVSSKRLLICSRQVLKLPAIKTLHTPLKVSRSRSSRAISPSQKRMRQKAGTIRPWKSSGVSITKREMR